MLDGNEMQLLHAWLFRDRLVVAKDIGSEQYLHQVSQTGGLFQTLTHTRKGYHLFG
jgi:hypothetical protein